MSKSPIPPVAVSPPCCEDQSSLFRIRTKGLAFLLSVRQAVVFSSTMKPGGYLTSNPYFSFRYVCQFLVSSCCVCCAGDVCGEGSSEFALLVGSVPWLLDNRGEL